MTVAGLSRYSLAVPKSEIYYLSWTIDAYEGLGFLRTDDASEGLVSLFFPSEAADDVDALLGAFEKEGITIERRRVS